MHFRVHFYISLEINDATFTDVRFQHIIDRACARTHVTSVLIHGTRMAHVCAHH